MSPHANPRAMRSRVPAAALLLIVGLLVAACGSATEPIPSGPTGSGDPSGSDPAASASPIAPSASPPDGTGAATPDPAGSDGASFAPGEPVPATSCSGLPQNQDFYAGAAGGLEWQVYCAVLPEGWYVETGSYRLGKGGTLRISYLGPANGRIELREGAICAVEDACAPVGTAGPPARFGDRDATFLTLDGGGYAIAADPGAALSWVLYATNLDEATVRDLGAALLPVARP